MTSITLRLERGGEHVIWPSCTKTAISRLIHKISRHMIHQKLAYFRALSNYVGLSIKKILFPVQRVAKIEASRAAAIFFPPYFFFP